MDAYVARVKTSPVTPWVISGAIGVAAGVIAGMLLQYGKPGISSLPPTELSVGVRPNIKPNWKIETMDGDNKNRPISNRQLRALLPLFGAKAVAWNCQRDAPPQYQLYYNVNPATPVEQNDEFCTLSLVPK